MLNYRKNFSLILAVLLLLSSMVACNDKPGEESVYPYVQTADIVATVEESVSALEMSGYDIYQTELNVIIPDRSEISETINKTLSDWMYYAVGQIGVLRAQLEKQGSLINSFQVKNTVSYNENGLLSLVCFIEYTDYGEKYSIAINSAVWNLGTAETVPILQMIKMTEADYENFLTLNLDHNLNVYYEKLPDALKNAAGRYSGYVGYYIKDGIISFYTSCENMDYTFGYTTFNLAFSDDPFCFNYEIGEIKR